MGISPQKPEERQGRAVKRRGEGYQGKFLRLVAEGKLAVPPGTLSAIHIEHHPRCAFLGQRCRCDPDIIMLRRGVA